MTKLPDVQRLETETVIEDKQVLQDTRPYLGISSIGDSCARKLWYGFRLCKTDVLISARLNRLFQRGHREESIIQLDFDAVGIHHHSDQKEVKTGHGHIRGHIDNLLDGVPDAPKTTHLGEYKTHNDKSFKDLKKKGLLLSKPVHYAQMVCYMELLKITRGLYVAVNKNDDERYYERIEGNKNRATELLSRGETIISSEIPLPKIGGASWYECKWCNYYMICQFGEKPAENCRTCSACDICDGGKWECSTHKIELTFDQQKLGCKRYQVMKGLAS